MLVPLDRDEAERELRNGKVVAIVPMPAGFVAQLKAMQRSPRLELETTRGLLASRVTQQMQALVYSLNRELQDAFIAANLRYVDLILHGGRDVPRPRFDVLGLERAESRVSDPEVREFIEVAQLALDQTDDALEATANPIELETVSAAGRTWALSAQVQAHALALVTMFLARSSRRGALAAERDERVLQPARARARVARRGARVEGLARGARGRRARARCRDRRSASRSRSPASRAASRGRACPLSLPALLLAGAVAGRSAPSSRAHAGSALGDSWSPFSSSCRSSFSGSSRGRRPPRPAG